jgi:hypothetical protein
MLEKGSKYHSALAVPLAFALRGVAHDGDLPVVPPSDLSKEATVPLRELYTLMSDQINDSLGPAATDFWSRVQNLSGISGISHNEIISHAEGTTDCRSFQGRGVKSRTYS